MFPWYEALRQGLLEVGRHLICSPRSRRRQLQALRALDDRLLRDIGLTRNEALHARACRRDEEGPMVRLRNDERLAG